MGRTLARMLRVTKWVENILVGIHERKWSYTSKTVGWTSQKTCYSATEFTTNLTWTGLGWNPGLRGDRSATNRLSHGRDLNHEECLSKVKSCGSYRTGNSASESHRPYG